MTRPAKDVEKHWQPTPRIYSSSGHLNNLLSEGRPSKFFALSSFTKTPTNLLMLQNPTDRI